MASSTGASSTGASSTGASSTGASSTGADGPGTGEPLELRIDALASAAGTTVRNVRAYQDRGLLHPPRRTGRVGVYTGAHLARLRLIGSLLERGYTLANIGELLSAWERGQDVAAVLGLEAALVTPVVEPAGSVVDVAELERAFGAGADALAAEAVAVGVLEPTGDGRYRVADPLVLEVGRLLVGAGVPPAAVLRAARSLRTEVATLARLFVGVVEEHVVDPMGDAMPAEGVRALADLVASLRPLATQVVATELGLAMDAEIRERLGEHLARRAGVDVPGPRGPAARPAAGPAVRPAVRPAAGPGTE